MARARNIKPSFFKNELLGEADPLLGLLFISLWTLADKAGRLEDRPLRIKAETFPYRENININGYLTQLVSMGFIDRYLVDGVAIIQVINFSKHQSPHSTEKTSELPCKPIDSPITVKQPLDNESTNVDSNINVLIPDLLIPDSFNPITPLSDRKKKITTYDDYPEFLEFWAMYPRKDDKKKSFEAWKKNNPPIDQVINALSWQIVSDQWTKNNGQFIPLGETYINGARWEAEPIKLMAVF